MGLIELEGAPRIRVARADDLPSVVEIEHLCFQDPWPEESLAEELRHDARRLPIVAEDDSGVVGVALVWTVADEMHILSLGVHPRARRRGVASGLLSEIRERGLARGATLITLEVREHNQAAQVFYRRHGFLEVARRPRYYPDTHEDALVLILPLAPRGGGPALPGDSTDH